MHDTSRGFELGWRLARGSNDVGEVLFIDKGFMQDLGKLETDAFTAFASVESVWRYAVADVKWVPRINKK